MRFREADTVVSDLQHRLVLQRGRGVRQPERLFDGRDDRRQDGVGSEGRFQALSEARDHGVRVVALTVHQRVHAALQTVAQRREDHGYESRGEQQDEKTGLYLQKRR